VVTAEQGAGLELLWGPVGAALAQLPGLDVIADCGRIGADGPHYDLLAYASAVLLVTRDTLAEVVRLRERIAAVSSALASRHRQHIPVGVAVVAGHRGFHAALADVRQALGGAAGSRLAEGGVVGPEPAERPGGTSRVIGGLAYDPQSAEALRGEWGGRLNRSLLLRTARELAGRLTSSLATPAAVLAPTPPPRPRLVGRG